jgi:hypothetical protein
MVVIPLQNQTDNELRINRTQANTFRDSNLKDTARLNRDNARYNPECKYHDTVIYLL